MSNHPPLPDDEDDIVDDTMQSWRNSPVTQRLLKSAATDCKASLGELLAACGKSADPLVARHYERYVATLANVELFRGKKP